MTNDDYAKLYKTELRYNEAQQRRALQHQKACEQKMAAAIRVPYTQLPNIPKQPHVTPTFNVAGSGSFFHNRQFGPVVSQTSHIHGNGFWSEIQITSDDHVRFKLFRGGWFAKVLFMLGKDPKLTDGTPHTWDSIGYQGDAAKLEVTLGKTYLKIDEIIADELGDAEHRKFIKDMASTDPENLKMIAGLKNLDDGMNEGSPKVPELNGTLTFDGAGFLQPSQIISTVNCEETENTYIAEASGIPVDDAGRIIKDPIAEAIRNDIVKDAIYD